MIILNQAKKPRGTFFTRFPDPTLYANPGNGICPTGIVFVPAFPGRLYAVDGEGKVDDSNNLAPRLWSVNRYPLNLFTNTFSPAEVVFSGVNIMAGLFEDGIAPLYNTGAIPVDSTVKSAQGAALKSSTGTIQLDIINRPGDPTVTWIINIDPATGARVSQFRTTLGVNSFAPINLPLVPSRGVALPVGTAFTVRNDDPMGSIGTGFAHGVTAPDMIDIPNAAQTIINIIGGPNGGPGAINGFTLDPDNAANSTPLGTYTNSDIKAPEGARSFDNTLFWAQDGKYHGVGLNELMIIRPNPLPWAQV